MILYTEIPKIPSIKLRSNTFIQVADYKINIGKSVAFLYINNKISEEMNNKKILFIIVSKIIKEEYVTKEVKDLLLSENYETLRKETDDDTNKWKDILCSWTGKESTLLLIKCP